mmetsp:Transcript_93652/g.303176  ORF Transcript_93652/g.303176 Transcript_93652/m.303176 type:complete len:105 (-) Transcript_93652:380-694(-)
MFAGTSAPKLPHRAEAWGEEEEEQEELGEAPQELGVEGMAVVKELAVVGEIKGRPLVEDGNSNSGMSPWLRGQLNIGGAPWRVWCHHGWRLGREHRRQMPQRWE